MCALLSPVTEFDSRFSEEGAIATPWPHSAEALAGAELYWLTTVRADGRPHVTPLVGVWVDDNFVFCTGASEQKARNLEHSPYVVVTTGSNTWSAGEDVIVEGVAEPVTAPDELQGLARAYFDKYGTAWQFEVSDAGFGTTDAPVPVFRVAPSKVLVFAKSPHGQTRHRFR